MHRNHCLAAVLFTSSACVATPQSGDGPLHPRVPVSFRGYDVSPNVELELQAASDPGGPFVTFASAKTGTTATTLQDGTKLYAWSERSVVPSWRTTCTGKESFVRVRSISGHFLFTYDAAGGTESGLPCVLQQLAQPGANTIQVLASCASAEAPVLRLSVDAPAQPTTHVGDLVIDTQAEADAYTCIETIRGSLTIGESPELSIALPHLKAVTGNLDLTWVRDPNGGNIGPTIRTIDLSGLTSVGGFVHGRYLGKGSDIISLKVGLPALTSVGGEIHIELFNTFNGDMNGLNALTALASDLTLLGGTDDASWGGLLPLLAQVGGDVWTRTGHSTYGVLKGLAHVAGTLRVEGFLFNPGVSTSFPLLSDVGGDLQLIDVGAPNLNGAPALPLLSTVAGQLSLSGGSFNLTDFALGAPAGLDVAGLHVTANTALDELLFDNLQVSASGPIEFTNNPALSTCDVETFVDLQESLGWVGVESISGNGGC